MSTLASPATPAPRKVLVIGVLLFPYFQWLDAAGPVDYLNTHSYATLKLFGVPESLLSKAFAIEWHYLSSTGTLDPVTATSGPPQLPTTTFETCPHLDYLLVPGPDPALQLPDACIQFIKARFPAIKGLLTVCTGSAVLAQTGVLDGVHTASNKMVLRSLAEKGALNRKVKWVGDRRFVVDGKVWSAAGLTAGIDLAAEFARVHCDAEIVEIVKAFAEYQPNPAQPDPFASILDGVKLD